MHFHQLSTFIDAYTVLPTIHSGILDSCDYYRVGTHIQILNVGCEAKASALDRVNALLWVKEHHVPQLNADVARSSHYSMFGLSERLPLKCKLEVGYFDLEGATLLSEDSSVIQLK
ncbi:hypothetical protein BWQ96_05896 [Gracilariopsis chorda]|uniref:Uncharacterized protein n=1 Tax=Gracilariopsis chorda TaxID=448386 RepID=A0A2V3IQF2_9FLOR|nr:hypothetical protein BWQ96_05896 [Gracilariopsis chorda]|eukprot:PXF44332.1 hypothetical protein BWQ96_05896 [Gracilariopsis chorda]